MRRKQALLGSFAIDLMAMTFGMPRALFPVLAVSVYGRGRERDGPAVRVRLGGSDGGGADHALAGLRAIASAAW